jgi:2,4-diaminopentanoate dehydrogenase
MTSNPPGRSTTDPYRVLVWGPGGLGRICIREALRLPEFELVGAFAYSSAKHGADLGALVGLEDTGIRATTDRDEALASDCDCILHLARNVDRYGLAVEEIAAMLRAGRNVITVHPFHHMEAMSSMGAPDGLDAILAHACQRGGVTFHATGIYPNFVVDRMAATLTGVCTDITAITVEEFWDMSQYPTVTLTTLGYGRPPEELDARPVVASIADSYCLPNLYGLAGSLGVELERMDVTHDYATSPTDLTFDTLNLAAGTVDRLTHTWHGYRRADDETPFATVQVNWMMGRDVMRPPGYTTTDSYVVTINGTLSVAMSLNFAGSVANSESFTVPGDREATPGYYATIATVLQAVPHVVYAEPGLLTTIKPKPRWQPDLRTLVTANSAR